MRLCYIFTYTNHLITCSKILVAMVTTHKCLVWYVYTAFSALTLLAGRQDEHPVYKKE